MTPDLVITTLFKNALRQEWFWRVPSGQVTFQVANVNKALGSVSKMARNGNRVVFNASGSNIENKMTNDTLWLRVREGDGVHVVDIMVAPAGREQKGKPSSGRRGT